MLSYATSYLITLPSRIIIARFLVIARLDFDVSLSAVPHVGPAQLIIAPLSDHLQDKDEDETEHDECTDDAGSNSTSILVFILVGVGSGIGVSRLALLRFLFVELCLDCGLFCINLGNLSVDLQLDPVGLSLAEHVDVGRRDYWDFGVDINFDDRLVDDDLWTISDGLSGGIKVLLGSIPVRRLCLNCLLQGYILS